MATGNVLQQRNATTWRRLAPPLRNIHHRNERRAKRRGQSITDRPNQWNATEMKSTIEKWIILSVTDVHHRASWSAEKRIQQRCHPVSQLHLLIFAATHRRRAHTDAISPLPTCNSPSVLTINEIVCYFMPPYFSLLPPPHLHIQLLLLFLAPPFVPFVLTTSFFSPRNTHTHTYTHTHTHTHTHTPAHAARESFKNPCSHDHFTKVH